MAFFRTTTEGEPVALRACQARYRISYRNEAFAIHLVLASAACGERACSRSSQSPAYRYIRAGEPANITVQPRAGFALMGGGTDLDEAFQFLCDRAGGGDLLVLRAHGDDEYNAYLRGICHLNSVATLIIPNREAQRIRLSPKTIKHASAIFIAGGDQANYINFWMNTPVQTALNDAIQRGVPIGGTSAGLAVMGEYVYTAQGDKPDDPNLDGKTALADPYGAAHQPGARISRHSDSQEHHHRHPFRAARSHGTAARVSCAARMSRTENRLPPAAPIDPGIGVDERAAVLLEPDGKAHVVGVRATRTSLMPTAASAWCRRASRSTYGPFAVQKVAPGADFYIKSWAGDAITYKLSVEAGKLRSTQTANEIY